MDHPFSRRTFLKTGGLALAATAVSGQGPRSVEGPPNIIFIVADDYGWADVGYHTGGIRTPNIDALAASGAKLESHYVMPVCTPTRCALMTGRYPIRYGRQYNVLRPESKVGLSLGERLLPEVLRDRGYETAICGKWHLGDVEPSYLPMARGFQHQYGFVLRGTKYRNTVVKGAGVTRDQLPCDDEGYLTHLITNEAVRHIEGQGPGAKPLFLYVPYHAVHGPHECPPEYSAPYQHLGPVRGIYAGMVAAMDEGIGKIMAAVEKRGIGGNTLIVFTSDNGGMTGKGSPGRNTPLRAGKGSLYEGGIRGVAFAAFPGRIPSGTFIHEPLHAVDWLPTLAALAGSRETPKNPLDGKDIWPVLTQGKPSPHEDILFNSLGRFGALRKGKWKLLKNPEEGEDDEEAEEKPTREEKRQRRKERSEAPDRYELYDLAADPGETRDLAAEQGAILAELKGRLEGYAKVAVAPIMK